MPVPSFTYTAQFYTNVGTPNVVITDTTDYTGFVVADMLAIIQESNSAGNFYQNVGWNIPSWSSPDLNGSTNTLTFQQNLPLSPTSLQVPLDTYTFVIIPYYDGAAQPAVTVVVPYTFSLPVPDLNIGYDCNAGQLWATDDTVYSDIQGAVLLSAVRTMTLTYPVGSGQGTIVTPNPLITIGANTPYQFWTNTYQLQVSTVCTFQLPNLSTVVKTITGEIDSGRVTCNTTLCNLRGCMYSVFQKWLGYCGKNAAQAEFYGNLHFKCEGYWADIIRSQQCGLPDQVNYDIKKLKELLAGEQCGCPEPNSDVSIQIFALNTVPLTCVVAAGTYISVTSVTVGNTTTYTVSVNGTFIGYVTTLQSQMTTLLGTTIPAINSAIAAIVSSKYLKLYEVPTDVTTPDNSQHTLGTYTINAGVLNNNDEVVIKAYVLNNADTGTTDLNIVDNSADILSGGWIFSATQSSIYWEIHLIKISNTTVRINCKANVTGFAELVVTSADQTTSILTVGDLSVHNMVISLLGTSVNVGGGMICQQFEVELFKA
jgi:uncharacterized membrane protein YjfL (UPF0719 family)